MRVQVTQENLNSALQSAGRIAGRNSNLPILANVLLRCSNNRLLVSATNLSRGRHYSSSQTAWRIRPEPTIGHGGVIG